MARFWSDWDNLQKYNFVLFVVHLILTIALWIYFQSIENPGQPVSQINLDLYDHLYKFDSNTNVFEVVSQKVAKISESSISLAVVSFFGITSLFHLFYAMNPGNLYLSAVKNGNNYFRWLEYTITATTMIIIIAILAGVKDIKAYFVLVTASVAMIASGQWFETATGAAKWLPITVGFIILLGIFTSIWMSFNDRMNDAKDAGFNIPSWLWLTVVVLFLFYASFGAVPVVQATIGGDYRKYETAYLTLSLLSKTSLGLLVGYGFSQRQQAELPS